MIDHGILGYPFSDKDVNEAIWADRLAKRFQFTFPVSSSVDRFILYFCLMVVSKMIKHVGIFERVCELGLVMDFCI